MQIKHLGVQKAILTIIITRDAKSPLREIAEKNKIESEGQWQNHKINR